MPHLESPLTSVLPTRQANALRTQRGLETVGDLLAFLPRRYLDRHRDLGELVDGAQVVFVGRVVQAQTRAMRSRRGSLFTATVSSGPHRLDLTFFQARGHSKALVPGTRAIFAGQVSRYRQAWQLAHPVYEVLDADADADADGDQAGDAGAASGRGLRALVPVYPEVKGLPSWTLNRLIKGALARVDIPDHVPAHLLQRHGLPDLATATRLVHVPESWAERDRGRARLKYDEALAMQIALARRRHGQAQDPSVPRHPRPGGLLETFDARLPFALTEGQARVGETIAAGLAAAHPMHRLLQGEVGSGKTVVALRAMLAVADAGGQSALLAPTEVLAAQHHRSISALLGDLAEGGMLGGAEQGTQVALLTGSQNAAARRAALLAAASGRAGIVVGTHALIQEQVQFADLGLVVVDEQHRFGVEQRDALRAKAVRSPHVLVMTATPIPRTVAMTVFGDMETSTLTELPPGRAPVTTHVVDNPRWYARAWARVAEEVAAGHRGYVVCPRIGAGQHEEGEEGGGGRGVLETVEELRAMPELAGTRIGLLHGRLPPEDKDAVMGDFAAGRLDILVATTVVEVGVDVPEATIMVVLDADRFGVSQLHQLRGRVGRGTAPGVCLLVTEDPPPGAAERLAAVAATTDGFALSRLDLEQRREGDVLGARQSGAASTLRVLRLLDDEDVIADARRDAGELVGTDPELAAWPLLRASVEARLDPEQAAFLERG